MDWDELERAAAALDLGAEDRAALERVLWALRGVDPGRAPTLAAGDATFDEHVTRRADESGPVALPERDTDRFTDLGPLGAGGMGEVRRVRQNDLNRVVARKTLLPYLAGDAASVARFVEEARLAAQLQHPGIVPVYEIGRDEDGRAWFTMREVRGRTLTEVITAVHAASDARDWGVTADGWSLRRLVEAFRRACEAVAYAHGRGVLHRDLKPDNVLLGEDGEVLVVDWGVAKVLDTDAPDPVVTARDTDPALRTRPGGITGTPVYMAPEQAAGARLDLRADVYSLGALLYEILAGHPPYVCGTAREALMRLVMGAPPPVATVAPRPIPEGLAALCEQAMARDREERPDARALARAVGAWLEGVQRRERALALVAQAEAADAEADALAARAATTRGEADTALREVPEWASEVEKAAAWALADHAESLAQRASMRRLEAEQMLHGALAHDPDRVEAHAVLARRYHAAHRAAEARGDAGEALRAELFLRTHAARLPERDPLRREIDAWLTGGGALTLLADPPAEATLYRYEVRNRRLVPERVRLLGATPLRGLPLDTGSYLVVLRAPGRAEVRYPVRIGRREDWDAGPHPIPLPPAAELDAADCYVPAGWFSAGGDPEAEGALPPQRVWVDGFVMRRDPVTNREYIAFLDDLVARGREAEALRYAPRERAGAGEDSGALIYGRRPDGGFELRPDADGDCWAPDWPVVMVDWFCARAYARWFAERTGRPWRLPTEMEWEKAARGVDARLFPWGDACDPAWCCMQGSHRERPLPKPVQDHAADESPYGVRGLGGNAMDWCADRFVRGAGLVDPPAPDPDEDAPDERARRGGAWALRPAYIRAARRNGERATNRNHYCGFRLARSLT